NRSSNLTARSCGSPGSSESSAPVSTVCGRAGWNGLSHGRATTRRRKRSSRLASEWFCWPVIGPVVPRAISRSSCLARASAPCGTGSSPKSSSTRVEPRPLKPWGCTSRCQKKGEEERDRPHLFFGGERFVAQQLEDGTWSVLDRRYREQVGEAEQNHEIAERRVAALHARGARLR